MVVSYAKNSSHPLHPYLSMGDPVQSAYSTKLYPWSYSPYAGVINVIIHGDHDAGRRFHYVVYMHTHLNSASCKFFHCEGTRGC